MPLFHQLVCISSNRSHCRSEVGKHFSRQSCWIVVHEQAYDVTRFLDSHPGGAAVILKYAGQDATKAFDQVHSEDILHRYLEPGYCIVNCLFHYCQYRESF